MNIIARILLFPLLMSAWLSAQGIIVTSPNGGETWAIGSDYTITWGSNNLSGNVKVGLFKGGAHLGNIVEHQNYQQGVLWHVGNALLNGATYGAGTDYQIQVQSEVNWQWKDLSDNNFTLTSGGGTLPKFDLSRYKYYEINPDPGCPMCGIFDIGSMLGRLVNPPIGAGLVLRRNGIQVADLGKLGSGRLNAVKIRFGQEDFGLLGLGGSFELALIGADGKILQTQPITLKLKQ